MRLESCIIKNDMNTYDIKPEWIPSAYKAKDISVKEPGAELPPVKSTIYTVKSLNPRQSFKRKLVKEGG